MTYDLRSDYLARGAGIEDVAEFDSEETIEAIEGALAGLGHEVERIGNARSLIEALAAGRRWDLVFNIAEGMNGRAREAQVPAILDVYDIPYTFSDPVTLGVCLDKGLTKRILRDADVPTPDFQIVNTVAEARRVRLSPPLFAKPVAEGTGKGISSGSRVFYTTELADLTERLLERYRQPVLVECFLPGREFTVGIVGTGTGAVAVGALELKVKEQAHAGIYAFETKEHCEDLVDYVLATGDVALGACRIGLDAWKALGCRDAGRVDLRADEHGDLAVLELNPLAGLHPTHSDLPMVCTEVGITYQDLIGRIVRSASERSGLPAAVMQTGGRG
jgi:D-alanine-D-alanine ligase